MNYLIKRRKKHLLYTGRRGVVWAVQVCIISSSIVPKNEKIHLVNKKSIIITYLGPTAIVVWACSLSRVVVVQCWGNMGMACMSQLPMCVSTLEGKNMCKHTYTT